MGVGFPVDTTLHGIPASADGTDAKPDLQHQEVRECMWGRDGEGMADERMTGCFYQEKL